MTESSDCDEPEQYKIKVKEHLDKKWSNWFEGMSITYEGKQTILTGYVADQSSLHGLLNRIRDLNLTLILVERIESNRIKN